MMNLSNLEKELITLESLREQMYKKEKELIEEFYKIEKETFEGKTYREYVTSRDFEETIDNLYIKIRGHNIYVKYQLDGVLLSAYGTIWEDGFVNITADYPTKTLDKVPKKYEKEEKYLQELCKSYKVINPVSKLKEKYRINYY